ncbi:MAG TPA: hypothetical protein VMT88_08455 [Actinomycetes bacterium]|nr:hypothetical protein [Actinomycetes bacterium]
MKRIVALLLSAVVSGAALAPVAAYADKPEHADYKLVFRSACDFRVSVHEQGKVSVKTFKYRSGRFSYKQIFTSPGLKATFENLQSGKTVRFNIAGPGITKVERGGSRSDAVLGPWGWDYNPETGQGGLWITTGRAFTVYDKRGKLISFRFSGRLVDVCSALAA